jgi:lysozyme family protein
MDDLFDRLDAPTAKAEGGYVNDPNDRGGETNHGITVAVARENGYSGPMAAMTADQAKAIRRAKYWIKPGIYLIAPLSERVAAEVYDTGVNMGTGTAAMFLQRALNALNRQATDYPDIAVDGGIGRATASALTSLINVRGKDRAEAALLKMLNCLQGARYVELAELRSANEQFELGWFENRIQL